MQLVDDDSVQIKMLSSAKAAKKRKFYKMVPVIDKKKQAAKIVEKKRTKNFKKRQRKNMRAERSNTYRKRRMKKRRLVQVKNRLKVYYSIIVNTTI